MASRNRAPKSAGARTSVVSTGRDYGNHAPRAGAEKAVARESSEIDVALQGLQAVVEDVELVVGAVCDRTAAVQKPIPVGASAEGKAESGAPLTEDIRKITTRLQMQRDRLNQLLQRLAL